MPFSLVNAIRTFQHTSGSILLQLPLDLQPVGVLPLAAAATDATDAPYPGQVNELLSARRRFLADMSGLLDGRLRVRDLMNNSLAAARATHIGEDEVGTSVCGCG